MMGMGMKWERRRFVATLKLECFMLLCDFFLYSQLMVYFESKDCNKLNNQFLTKTRTYASAGLVCFMVASQMMYFLYFASEEVQDQLFDVCAFLSGTWINLLGLVVGCFIVNSVMRLLNATPTANFAVRRIRKIPLISSFVFDRRCQIKAVLLVSVVLSFLMWCSSDDIVVKQVTIPIKNFSGFNGSVKIALLSDVHAGATVRRAQIAKVADKLRDLDVDAVALVGDMVDGPVKTVASHMEPLWSVLKRHRTYFVTGNHEYYYGDAMMWFVEYEMHGVRVLNNRCEMFRNICVIGVNDVSSKKSGILGHRMNLTEASRNCSEGSSRLLLAHNPSSLSKFPASELNKIDVVLSGTLFEHGIAGSSDENVVDV
ncbi:Ser/Thr phosphatase family protein [Cooperia oncophora]